MEDRLIYITNPANLVSFVIFVFGLGATRSKLNGKIKVLEEKMEELDAAKIEVKLAEILADLAWIKEELKKVK